MKTTDSIQLDSRNNNVYLLADENPPCVIKTYRKKKHSSIKALRYRLQAALGYSTPTEYQGPQERLAFEIKSLELWRQHGFLVPQVLSNTMSSLCMGYIQGQTLATLFANQNIDVTSKLTLLKSIYQSMSNRHKLAFQLNEQNLIAFDSNLRNLIWDGEKIWNIDFEMGQRNEPIENSAARELKKFSLEAINSLPKEAQPNAIDILCKDYSLPQVLELCATEELNRYLKKVHLWRGKRRKIQTPGLFSKIDLAQAILDRILTRP